jgi:NTP pyrophosphatase (non-canonical NTP hydrolase)
MKSLDFLKLLQRYQKIDTYFDEKFPQLRNEYKVLARLGKITEELGELHSAVHGEFHLHRADKQQQHHTEDVAKEWADVFNTVILAGMTLGLDMPKVIDERLQEIYQRYDFPLEKQK